MEVLKKNLAKQTTGMRGAQKEFQTAQLETEQAAGDLAAAREQLEDVTNSVTGMVEEIEKLKEEQARVKVRIL